MPTTRSRNSHRRALALGTGLAALIAAVAIVVLGSAARGDTAAPGGYAEPPAPPEPSVLNGIPQHGLVLGDPGAKVELIEFGDLTSPISKEVEEKVLPGVIRTEVAKGKAKLVFRNFKVMGPEAVTAGTAAIAAGEQGHGWNFIELAFADQGKPNSGHLDAGLLEALAEASGVTDLARWATARNGAGARAEVKATTAEAERLGVEGVPTFAVRGPRSGGLQFLTFGGPGLSDHGETASIERAIEAAG